MLAHKLLRRIKRTSVVPEGVDFDGVSDYLSRSSDLVGNVDSYRVTCSFWIYNISTGQTYVYDTKGSYHGLDISVIDKTLSITGRIAGGTVSIEMSSPTTSLPHNKWNHVCLSFDLTSATKKHIYINDLPVTITANTYTCMDVLDLTNANHSIGADRTGPFGLAKGRLSHLYLDYTYRDLSIEANRRLFITADGKPTPTATLKALNPILYLPMKDAATAHINEGTGGNFTLNGTIATSNRGANQDNCVASYFDGVADRLSRTSLIGAVDSKTITVSFIKNKQVTGYQSIFSFQRSSAHGLSAVIPDDAYVVNMFGGNSAGTSILNAWLSTGGVLKKNDHVVFSVDMADTNKRHIIVNGEDRTANVTWNKYINDFIHLNISTTPTYEIGSFRGTDNYWNGNIGELYIDTKYTDLATSNPFWDKDTNRPKPVRQVIRETGITPLIAMPLDACNAGKNYGTGGDFTANSAPYVGVRGASEYIARSIKCNGIAGNHITSTTTALGVTAPISSFSMVVGIKLLSIQQCFVAFGYDQNSGYITLDIANTANTLTIIARNGVSESRLSRPLGTNFNAVYISYNGVTLYAYSNGTSSSVAGVGDLPAQKFVNFTIGDYLYQGTSISPMQDNVSSLYFTTDYIDFSQEVNRLKFVDGFGFPKDLKAQIDAGVIPTPLIYLPFDEPTNLGKNLGTGGNFSVVGTVSAGADFSL